MALHVRLCFGACIVYLQTASIKYLLLAAAQAVQVSPAADADAAVVLPLIKQHWRIWYAAAAIAAGSFCTAQLSAVGA